MEQGAAPWGEEERRLADVTRPRGLPPPYFRTSFTFLVWVLATPPVGM
jgi:hypothetical protein